MSDTPILDESGHQDGTAEPLTAGIEAAARSARDRLRAAVGRAPDSGVNVLVSVDDLRALLAETTGSEAVRASDLRTAFAQIKMELHWRQAGQPMSSIEFTTDSLIALGLLAKRELARLPEPASQDGEGRSAPTPQSADATCQCGHAFELCDAPSCHGSRP